MAVVRLRLKAFFPRGPTGLGIRSMFSVAVAVAIIVIAALTATYALASCWSYSEPEGWGGGSDASPNVHRCYRAKPIDCASGNQSEAQTDLVLGGRGPALHITRTYNSQAAAEAESAGPWGYGWSGPYSSHAKFEESGRVTVVQENGAAVTFYPEGGGYDAGAWVQATLVNEGGFYVFTLPSQEKLKFNGVGALIEQKDRNGNALTFTRAFVGGPLLGVKDAAGRELKFTYTGAQVTSIEDPMGRKVNYAYESGNLASVTLPGEETPRWKFKYDASHQLTEMTDGRGGVTKTVYDANNRAKEQTDPMGRVHKFVYGESEGKKTTTITEPNGSTTFEKFNEAGEPLEVIKAKGTSLQQKTTYEYDTAYRLVKATDALGHSTTYGYNEAGDRTLRKDAEGNETKWTYNATHDVLTETSPKGEVTTFKRDSKGNVEAIERPAPGETIQKATFKYATNGDLESETDSLGRETKYEYDLYGNPKAEISPTGDKTSWTYDKDGQKLTQVSPRGNEEGAKASEFETVIERDVRGRPIKVTDPLGRETKYAYDKNGNLEWTTDALGHTVKYTYNANDEQIKVEKANGNTAESTYGSMGEVKSRTNGNGSTTKFEYDVLGQLIETIDPLERKTKREYDAAGNLKKSEDALGRTMSYAYDSADRLKEVNYSEASTADVTYKYDKNSNIVEMIDGTGTTTKVYDQLGRLTEVKNGKGEVVKYGYDLGNQQTEIVYPNGEAVKRAFDKAGRLEKVTDWLGKETTFSYNRDSQTKAITFPAATTNVDAYAYNRAGELTEVSMKKGAEVLASMSYTRDKLGQIEKTVETGFPEVPEYKYEYDAANRLTKSNGTTFGWDAANNVTKISSTAYTYDKGDQIATASNATFEFTQLGQRIKETPTGEASVSYTFDQAGNLATSKGPTVENTFKYDGTGLRTTETRNTATYPMVWDSTAGLPLLLRKGQEYYVYGPGGLPIEQITSTGTATYLHHDQLGSTRILTNSTGVVVGTYRYGPNGAFWKFTGTQGTQMGFAGQYRMHTQNQLIYMRARTYDPTTAQFLSVDPLVASSGESYSYAEGNPVNASDPSGLTPPAKGTCAQASYSRGGSSGGGSICFMGDGTGRNVLTWSWSGSPFQLGTALLDPGGSASFSWGVQWSDQTIDEQISGGPPSGMISAEVSRGWGFAYERSVDAQGKVTQFAGLSLGKGLNVNVGGGLTGNGFPKNGVLYDNLNDLLESGYDPRQATVLDHEINTWAKAQEGGMELVPVPC
jgi:RHS repeat-associated protein